MDKVYISKEALNYKGVKYFINLFSDDRLDNKIEGGFKSIDGLKIIVEYNEVYLVKSKKDNVFDTLRGWNYWLSTQG